MVSFKIMEPTKTRTAKTAPTKKPIAVYSRVLLLGFGFSGNSGGSIAVKVVLGKASAIVSS